MTDDNDTVMVVETIDVIPIAPCCIGGFVFLIIILFAYAFFMRSKQNALIHSLKTTAAKPSEGTPILVDGTVTGPEIMLPSTGEKCAYYAVQIFSKKSLMKKGWHAATDMKGFELSVVSGNFTVRSMCDGKDFTVDMDGMLGSFREGVGKTVSPTIYTLTEKYAGTSDTIRHKVDLYLEGKAVYGVLEFAFGYVLQKWEGRTQLGLPFYWRDSTDISSVAAKSLVNSAVHQYTIGKDVPPGIAGILAQKSVIGTLATDGDEIYVVETYIPLGAKVQVAGTLCGNAISYKDIVTGLMVSYGDLEKRPYFQI